MREAPSTTAMRYVGDTGFVCLVDLNLEPADKHVRNCQWCNGTRGITDLIHRGSLARQ